MLPGPQRLDARQNLRHDFRLRLRALRAFVVEADADGADGDDADLLGREPEREVAGVILEEKADGALARAERGRSSAPAFP